MGEIYLCQAETAGEYHNLVRLVDPESHFSYLRMSKERFDSLLARVSVLGISYSICCPLFSSIYIL